jgi:hypothetical protein
MPELVAALSHLFLAVQEAIHGPDGAKVLTLVQKGRVDLLGRFIPEPLRVEDIQDLLTFLQTEGTRRRGAFLSERRCAILFPAVAIHTGSGNPNGCTGGLGTDFWSKDFNRIHQSSSPISGFSRGIPSICEIFF